VAKGLRVSTPSRMPLGDERSRKQPLSAASCPKSTSTVSIATHFLNMASVDFPQYHWRCAGAVDASHRHPRSSAYCNAIMAKPGHQQPVRGLCYGPGRPGQSGLLPGAGLSWWIGYLKAFYDTFWKGVVSLVYDVTVASKHITFADVGVDQFHGKRVRNLKVATLAP